MKSALQEHKLKIGIETSDNKENNGGPVICPFVGQRSDDEFFFFTTYHVHLLSAYR